MTTTPNPTDRFTGTLNEVSSLICRWLRTDAPSNPEFMRDVTVRVLNTHDDPDMAAILEDLVPRHILRVQFPTAMRSLRKLLMEMTLVDVDWVDLGMEFEDTLIRQAGEDGLDSGAPLSRTANAGPHAG